MIIYKTLLSQAAHSLLSTSWLYVLIKKVLFWDRARSQLVSQSQPKVFLTARRGHCGGTGRHKRPQRWAAPLCSPSVHNSSAAHSLEWGLNKKKSILMTSSSCDAGKEPSPASTRCAMLPLFKPTGDLPLSQGRQRRSGWGGGQMGVEGGSGRLGRREKCGWYVK